MYRMGTKIENQRYYAKNKELYLQKQRDKRQAVREYIWKVKKESPCPCGEDHVAVLQFHHLDGEEKDIEISRAVSRGWGMTRLQKEIAKCVILCSNCHLKLHWEEKERIANSIGRVADS